MTSPSTIGARLGISTSQIQRSRASEIFSAKQSLLRSIPFHERIIKHPFEGLCVALHLDACLYRDFVERYSDA